jgi:hypothetical protein
VMAGTMIGDEVTVTLAVAFTTPVPLAVMVAKPADTPVKETTVLVAPAMKLAVGGTDATPGLLEIRLTFSPLAGAGADKFRATVILLVLEIVRLAGEKLKVGLVTCTNWLMDDQPVAEAVMVADPALTPVTCA